MNRTEIELVPQPERIVAFAGTTQCNESIPATADAVYVTGFPETALTQTFVGPDIVRGAAGMNFVTTSDFITLLPQTTHD